MKTTEYTKYYGEPSNFTMPCWFCNQSFDPLSHRYCHNLECVKASVNYTFEESHGSKVTFKLYVVNFLAYIGLKQFLIIYYPLFNKMEVREKIKLFPLGEYYLDVFTVPCESISLTPQNATTKLPILLTFS